MKPMTPAIGRPQRGPSLLPPHSPAAQPQRGGKPWGRPAVSLACWLSLTLASPTWAQATSPAPKPPAKSSALPAGPRAAAPVNSPLDAPLFYQLLLAEMQVRAGEPGIGYSLLLQAAQTQRDPLLFRRSVEVALQARSGESALAAAQAWAETLPEAVEAWRFQLQILLAINRPEQTPDVLRRLLLLSAPAEFDDAVLAIAPTYSRIADKAEALRLVQQALAPWREQNSHGVAVWTTLGRMQLAAERNTEALASAERAMRLDPSSLHPAVLSLELLDAGMPQAEALVRQHLNTPGRGAASDAQVALNYGRWLHDTQRLADARSTLEALTQRRPEIAESWLLLGSVLLQQNQLEAARQALQQHLSKLGTNNPERLRLSQTQAFLLLAQVAEKEGDFNTAGAWLDRIENADDIMAAKLRRAFLLARQGQLDAARQLLRAHPERRPEDARAKWVAEAQLLRELKFYPEAFEVYQLALARFSDDTDLMYEQAMVAEKIDRLDEMERLLRRLIALQPSFHHAYNALGYSLADRNLRLDEAEALIRKAVELAPNDAYIQDSLGWVKFRQGHTERALEILRSAYQARPDAEIAAHLGEVLWSLNQRDEALRIWREGHLLKADNDTLRKTLERFQVKP